jgi:putative membrane protein
MPPALLGKRRVADAMAASESPMTAALASFAPLLVGTLLLRPYVFAFLATFAVAATRDLGVLRMLGFLAWGFAVAFAAEYASTRVGIPFGLYHYTGATRGAEFYLANVPFFDSLSFPFLAYASFCLARWALGPVAPGWIVLLSGVVMMLLDVVIDPLSVRGDQWFLGRIFYYAEPGVYFGVPLSNFAGWMIVGWATVGGYVAATGRRHRPHRPELGIGLYYGVLLFSLTVTWWIGELALLAVGILIHLAAFLLLFIAAGAARRVHPAPAGGRDRR